MKKIFEIIEFADWERICTTEKADKFRELADFVKYKGKAGDLRICVNSDLFMEIYATEINPGEYIVDLPQQIRYYSNGNELSQREFIYEFLKELDGEIITLEEFEKLEELPEVADVEILGNSGLHVGNICYIVTLCNGNEMLLYT